MAILVIKWPYLSIKWPYFDTFLTYRLRGMEDPKGLLAFLTGSQKGVKRAQYVTSGQYLFESNGILNTESVNFTPKSGHFTPKKGSFSPILELSHPRVG